MWSLPSKLIGPWKAAKETARRKKKKHCFLCFFGNSGYPSQLTRTTTNSQTHWTPCKSSRQVRHYGDNRRARWDSNPDDKGKKTFPLLLATSLGKKKKKNTVNVYVAVEGIINFCTDENIMLKISDFVERLFFD
jgi:hypothetical protein